MINTILSSSILVLIILAIRFAFKGKINPMVQYGLWSLVALRLMAFSWLSLYPIESAFSVMNVASNAAETLRGASSVDQVITGNAAAGTIDNAVLIMDNVRTGVMTSGDGISAAAAIDWQLVIMIVWALGTITLGMWLIHVNRKFGKKVFENRRFLMSTRADDKIEIPVYVAEDLDSPCLMSYKQEVAIYVTSEVAADQEKLRYAIAHESCHYRHHDLNWSIVRCGLLAFYWFHPLVWAAAVMSKRDCELACDYGVIKEIGEEDRLAYGKTLVGLISQRAHKNNVLSMATSMYGSVNGIKERVTMIARNKKMKATTILAVLLIVALSVGCTFTTAKSNTKDLSEEEKSEIGAFAVRWADAFSERDAATIYELSENEELYFTIGDVAENGAYWMGWSSPWPWDKDYRINIVDENTFDIYYYFRTSTPSIYVAKETITIKKVGDEFKVVDEVQEHFDTIESKADFDQAYKLGIPDFTMFTKAYQLQADENAWEMTEILENPANAAIHQLNLKGAKVTGVYQDPYIKSAVVKFSWDDGEVTVNLTQPIVTLADGTEKQATIWIVMNESELNGNTPKFINYNKISKYMEEESKAAFSPYYELLDYEISDYKEEVVNGKVEAIFLYKIIHKNYDKDPDTVAYIKEAKESGDRHYQQLYDEYLQPQEMNFDLKVVIDEKGFMTLYSNISPKGIKWEETKMADFIINN